MADNVTLPGAGIPVASDEIDGVQYQRVKACFGEDGNASDVSESSPLPISAQEFYLLFERILSAVAYPPWFDRSVNAIRNQVQSGTVSTVTTCSTVSNLTQVDSIQGRLLPLGMNIDAWANTVRRTIS